MLIENIHVIKFARSSARKYYESLGIKLPEVVTQNSTIEITSSQLSKQSGQRIEYYCDCCGNKKSTVYNNYFRSKEVNNGIDLCNKCSITKSHIKFRLRQEDVISRLKEIHGNKYTYDNLIYINNNTKINVTCKKHGDFSASPENMLYNKSGCPICKESKGEKFIANYLNNNGIPYLRQYSFKELKNILPLRVDFYLSNKNLVIEFDGEQHYNYKPKFHKTFCEFVNLRKRDRIKEEYFKDNNITLLRLSDIKNIKKLEQNLNKVLWE